jgi:hypothetical protein
VATVTKIGGAVVIGRAPVNLRDIKRDQINRKDHPTLVSGGYRTGYYFYDTRWCDDYFWYPHYCFDPWSYRCCVSPWYYYPMLPPYVAWDRCHFYGLNPWYLWTGYDYQWSRPNYYGNYDTWGSRRGSSEIDYAVDDIVNAFERADRRAAGRLVSQRSEVAIYVDGNYSYTLNADDFYDMFLDATQNTKTKRYEILKVETGRADGSDCIRVTARHEYEDPWGDRTSVNHFYELRYEGTNLVISKFGVSGR